MQKRNYGWWVICAVILLSVGGVAGAVLMAVFAPDGLYKMPIILKASWLNVLTALSTLVAAVGAVLAAVIAIRISKAERIHRDKEKTKLAESYIISLCGDLYRANKRLERSEMSTLDGKIIFASREDFVSALKTIGTVDVLRVANASPRFARNISGVRMMLIALDEAFGDGEVWRTKTSFDLDWENTNGRPPDMYALAMSKFEECIDASFALLNNKKNWDECIQ